MRSEEWLLFHAIETGDVEAVVTLLRDPSSGHARRSSSLVELAVRLNRALILDVLLTHGWASQANDGTSQNQDESDDYRGPSPLCSAVELGHDDCTRVLLAHGARADAPSLRDGSLLTPLHVAAMFDIPSRLFHKLLLPATTTINAKDMTENTPLHLAAAYGSYAIARDLITSGADVNLVNASGSTPLHLAASNGFASLVELLLDQGVDVDATDALGNTPLIDAAFVNPSASNHFACGDAKSQSRVIQLLLDRGADVDACNRDGNSAICGAVRNGYTDAVFALLERGACATTQNRNDESVLHVAARAGVTSVEIWRRLLVAGANVLARDRYDRTCYCIWITRPKATAANEQPEEDNVERERTIDDSDEDPVTLVLEAALMAR